MNYFDGLTELRSGKLARLGARRLGTTPARAESIAISYGLLAMIGVASAHLFFTALRSGDERRFGRALLALGLFGISSAAAVHGTGGRLAR